MRNIAIIPARGGSKRIPRKNIKQFIGKPIISYSIESALKSNLFDEVMVSTDDTEIANIAIQYGAKVPFIRSDTNAGDNAGTLDVLYEVLLKYKKVAQNFDFICCIYPTAPFTTADKLIKAYNILINSSFDCVFPVVRFSYPIQRALKLSANNRLTMFWPENEKARSQDLEKAYHDAGLFYWYKSGFFKNNSEKSFDNCGGIVYEENEVQDIDSMNDWKIAEMKYKLL